MAKKRENYLTYKNNFKRVVEKKIEVVGCKYDTEVSEVIENAAEYRQCYMPGDKVREQLPRYWYISKEGFLVNVKNADKPKWVRPNLDSGRPQFKISKYNKPIATYMLVALVWGSYRTKNAQTVLDQRGVRGIGRFELKKKQHIARVQAHHIRNYIKEKSIENYISNNDPENIQLVTVREHDVLNRLQEGKTDVMLFYQPSFMNVPNNEIQAYDIENAKMMDVNQLEIVCVLSGETIPFEKDSIIIGEYIVVLEDGRAFLEAHKNILKEHLFNGEDIETGKSYEIYNGQKYFYCEYLDKRLYYRKIKK